MNNITSVIGCFITRFGKKHNIRVVVIDCTIQKMQRHRVCCVQTPIGFGQHPTPIAPGRVRMIDSLV